MLQSLHECRKPGLAFGRRSLSVKIAALANLMLLLSAIAANAQNLVAPEVVQLENLQVEDYIRTLLRFRTR
jgi:hypothetical protein